MNPDTAKTRLPGSSRLHHFVFGRAAKWRLLTAALFATVVPAATAAQSQLRYEWAASPAGPYAAIPAEMLKVQADGSATVVTPAPRGFFRLSIADGGGGGGSVPVRLLDSVPATTLAMLNRFI